MNDDQLIQLLREKPPEEFTSDEIALVRHRLPHCSQLRQAVADHLELEQALYHARGGVQLSVDDLVRRASLAPASRGVGKLFGWPTAAAILLTLFALGVVVYQRGDRRHAAVAQVKAAGAPRNAERDAPPSPPKQNEPVLHVVRKPPAGSAMGPAQSEPPALDPIGGEPDSASTALDASDATIFQLSAVSTPARSASEAVASDKPADAAVPAAEAWFTGRLEIDNEALRGSAELAAAIEHRAWRDACRVIVATAAEHGDGLTPDTANDRLCSFSFLVSEAVRRHAALRRAMSDDYDAEAWVDFRRAADRGDAAAMTAIAERFLGTSAATAARQWLGDQTLSAGRFRMALGHYRAAAELASDEQRGSLSARVRLSGALLGLELEQPVTETIELAGEQLSPVDFERLVTEMRTRADNPPSAQGAVAGELIITIADEHGQVATARKPLTGAVVWRERLEGVSLADPTTAVPITIDDRLLVCLAVAEAGGGTRVNLVTIAARTGEIVARRPLVRLRADESQGTVARLEVAESSLVVTIGDLLFHTDLEGRPRWVGHAIKD